MKFPSPFYIPWLHSGISYFLLPSEARVAELKKTDSAVQVPPVKENSVPKISSRTQNFPERNFSNIAKENAPSFSRQNPQATARSETVSTRGIPSSAPQGGQPSRGYQEPPYIAQPPSFPSPQRPVRNNTIPLKQQPDIPAVPMSKWPSSWIALRDRKPLPTLPLVLWTYPGLATDLAGSPDPKRRAIIANLVKALRNKSGTHVFWPFDLPEENGFTQADLFWSGVSLLNSVRHILLFGQNCCSALNISPPLTIYLGTHLYGKIILQLPSFESLTRTSFNSLLAFLQRELKCYAKQ